MSNKKRWIIILIYAVSIIGIFFLGQRIILDKTIPMDRLRIYQYMCYFAILWITHIFSRESIKQYRAEFSIKNFIKNIIIGILIFVILFFVFIFVSGFSVFSMKIHMGIPQFLYMLFFQICIVGATEEISFRGFLLREISAATTGNLGIFLSSALFAAVHIKFGLPTVILSTIFGFILAALRRDVRISLTSLAIAHGLLNALLIIISENVMR